MFLTDSRLLTIARNKDKDKNIKRDALKERKFFFIFNSQFVAQLQHFTYYINIHVNVIVAGLGSTAGIATLYGLDGLGVESR